MVRPKSISSRSLQSDYRPPLDKKTRAGAARQDFTSPRIPVQPGGYLFVPVYLYPPFDLFAGSKMCPVDGVVSCSGTKHKSFLLPPRRHNVLVRVCHTTYDMQRILEELGYELMKGRYDFGNDFRRLSKNSSFFAVSPC